MKRLIGIVVMTLMIPLVVMSQKDWRQMERKKIVNEVSARQLKNGLNQVTSHSRGFKLFAVAKDNKITGWQAKDTRGRKLKITRYEHPATADDSKDPNFKVIVVCVEAKEVCYEVQLVPTSPR